jgi:hypothetical protein
MTSSWEFSQSRPRVYFLDPFNLTRERIIIGWLAERGPLLIGLSARLLIGCFQSVLDAKLKHSSSNAYTAPSYNIVIESNEWRFSSINLHSSSFV